MFFKQFKLVMPNMTKAIVSQTKFTNRDRRTFNSQNTETAKTARKLNEHFYDPSAHKTVNCELYRCGICISNIDLSSFLTKNRRSSMVIAK